MDDDDDDDEVVSRKEFATELMLLMVFMPCIEYTYKSVATSPDGTTGMSEIEAFAFTFMFMFMFEFWRENGNANGSVGLMDVRMLPLKST